MVTIQRTQKEVERLKGTHSFLTKLSNTLCILGGLVIIIGLVCILGGFDDLNSYDEAKKIVATSILNSGIAGVISGIFFLFFGAIGRAINDIRIHTIADFNLRYEDVEATKIEDRKKQMTEENQTKYKKGDRLIHKTSGDEVLVVGVDGHRFICEREFLSGQTTYDESELEPIAK